jgi:hypothetical protein
MPVRRTALLRPFGIVLTALMLTWPLSGCRLGPQKAAVLDARLRPVRTKGDFPDLKGDPLEEIAAGLAKLGAVDFSDRMFRPDEVVHRGEFITWLVRTNDIFFRDQPDRQIRLASTREIPAFTDVLPSTQYFPYVQGMVDAGYMVGWGEPELKYDHNLTREWLVVLRDGIDLGKRAVVADPATYNTLRVSLRTFLKDADLVSDRCLAAVLADVTRGNTMRLAFGATNRLDPKRTVIRRQAALALSQLRGRNYRAALRIEPKWQPLSPEEKKALDQKMKAEEAEHGEEHEHGGE